MSFIVTDAGNIPFKGLVYTSFSEYGTGGYRLVVENEIVNPESFFDWTTTPIWENKNNKVTLSNGNYFKWQDTGKAYSIISCYKADGTDFNGLRLYVQTKAPWMGKSILCPFTGNGKTYVTGRLVYNPKGFYGAPEKSFIDNWASAGGNDLTFYQQQTDMWIEFLKGSVSQEETDPFGPGGTTGSGGGTGDFDGTGDEIGIPSLPTLSAVDAGFITLFNPSLGEMQNLASYMWSDLFDVNGWKKIFSDPMQAILGLSIVPVAVPNGEVKSVKVGNISTGVNMTTAASQYVEVDCGSLNVNEYWGAYLDYDPYTKAEIYLPYIGIHPISTDDIMNKTVHVVYHVDILSGSCCAYVQCGGTVLYSFIGQCASSIPITGDNWTNVINGAISIAGSIGSMVATGGASSPMDVSKIASTAVNTMKPSIEKSGAMGGTGGMLAVQTPYLILTRPRQALPKKQNTFMGYPSFITELLSDLSGYTEIDSIHLENVPATEQELSEIESLLKGGVIF